MIKTSQTSIHEDEDVFMFDSFSQLVESLTQAKGTDKQSTADLTLPLLIGGVLLLTLGLCVWMVVYGVKARKRYFVTEGPRVRISPSNHIMESQDRLDMAEEDDDINTIPYP